MLLPVYSTDRNKQKINIGEFNNFKGNLRIMYAKVRDEFANKLSIKVPIPMPKGIKKVELFDKDFEGMQELDLALFLQLCEDAIKEGNSAIKIPLDKLKKVR